MSTKAIWNIKSQQLIMLERSVTFFFCPCEIQEEKSKGVAVHTVVCVCGKMNTLAIRVEKWLITQKSTYTVAETVRRETV